MDTLTDAIEKAQQLVDLTLGAGATEADVFLQLGQTTHVTWQNEHLAQSSGDVCGLAVRAWSGDKVALLTTNNLASTHLAALSRFAVQEANQGIVSPPDLCTTTNEAISAADIWTDDSRAVDENVAEFKRLVSSLQSNISSFQGMLHISLSESRLATILVNSSTFKAAYTSRNYRLWAWIEGSAGHQTIAVSSRNFKDLIPRILEQQVHVNPAFLVGESRHAPAGYCQVVFSPVAGADIAHTLGTLFMADRLMVDLKPLLKHMGRQIASSALTLIDDSVIQDGVRSRPFDDEGTPSQSTTILEHGILRALLHTRYTAATLGMYANGKATRAEIWKQPRSSISTIYIQKGTEEPEDLFRQMQRGIFVTNVLRPGRIQGGKGKFMIVVQGWWLEHGKPVYPVSGVSLSSPIFDLLRNLRTCGTDLQFSSLSDGAGSPSIFIEKMLVE